MRGRIVVVLVLTVVAASIAVVACVGDSGSPVIEVIDDASSTEDAAHVSTDAGGSVDTGADTGAATDSGGTDGGGAGSDGSAPFACIDGGLLVFAPKDGLGPFCGKGANADGGFNTCNYGDHCCIPPGVARSCAPSCTGGGADFQCIASAHCSQDAGIDGGPLVCCTDSLVTLDTTTCSYPIFTSVHHGVCQPSCGAGSRQLCATQAECGGATCVGAGTPYQSYGVAVCQ
jgi:hypothetical protein